MVLLKSKYLYFEVSKLDQSLDLCASHICTWLTLRLDIRVVLHVPDTKTSWFLINFVVVSAYLQLVFLNKKKDAEMTNWPRSAPPLPREAFRVALSRLLVLVMAVNLKPVDGQQRGRKLSS